MSMSVFQGYINLTREIGSVINQINDNFDQNVRYSSCVALFENRLEPLLEKSRSEMHQLSMTLQVEDLAACAVQQAVIEAKVSQLQQKIFPATWFADTRAPEDPVCHVLSFLGEADFSSASYASHTFNETSESVPDYVLGEIGHELGLLIKTIKSSLTREERGLLESSFENLAALQMHPLSMGYPDIEKRKSEIVDKLCQLYRLIHFERFKTIRSKILNASGFPNLLQAINRSLDVHVIERTKEALERGETAREVLEKLQLLLSEEGRFFAVRSVALIFIRNDDIEGAFYIMDESPPFFSEALKYIMNELLKEAFLNPEGEGFSRLVNVIQRFTPEGSLAREEILKLAINAMVLEDTDSENPGEMINWVLELIAQCTAQDSDLRVSLLEELLPHLWNHAVVGAVDAILALTASGSDVRALFLNKCFDYVFVNAQNLEAFSTMELSGDPNREYPADEYSDIYLWNAVIKLTEPGSEQRTFYINRAIIYFYESNHAHAILGTIARLPPEDAQLRASLEQEVMDNFYINHRYSLILTAIRILSDGDPERRTSMMERAIVYFYTNGQDRFAQKVIARFTEPETEGRSAILRTTIHYLHEQHQHNRVETLVHFLEENQASDDEGDEEFSD